jgi:hypothetical protein
MKIYLMKILFPLLIILFIFQPAISQDTNVAVTGNADQIHFSVISSTSVTFDWVGSTDIIRIGTKPKKLIKTVKGTNPSFLPVTSPWKSDPGPYWEAKITGLKQNTTYYYSVGNSGINKFRTPPAPGSGGFRVCLTSDIHESSKECIAMFGQIAGLKPDLVLTTGDVTGAGPDGQQEIVNRFHDAMIWSLSAAWMPAWGNHDWEYTDVDDLRSLKGRFDIPNPGTISNSPAISCCGEDWGWFDYGNTRFISYPEPWSSASWIEWETQVKPVLEGAQKDPKIKFIVTYGHRSAYTSTYRRSPGDTRIRAILDGFHTAYSKYVLDLSGHNHQYERWQVNSGMNYIVNSSTGSYYHEGWDKPEKPQGCVFRAIHYGILVLDFTGNSIKGKFVCSAGTTQTGPDYKPLEEPVCDEPGSIIDSFIIK